MPTLYFAQPGYARLCCLGCIQTRDTNHGTTCICRVPTDKLKEVSHTIREAGRSTTGSWLCPLARVAEPSVFVCASQGTVVECQTCGCRGCGG